MSEQQLTVMLAGPGHEVVIYQMQPAFLHDARFNIVGTAQNWENLQDNLPKLKPEMLILQANYDLVRHRPKQQVTRIAVAA